ncbi:MAG TPA: 30S ribosome-binding factor RbfA [Thermodesulfatator atlanticus]|uniref:Ribosome-binding factor A n=1 Tax=Thermodesulfatator atlanticus TaxID=501497 RepID=A0A7V5P090_9BACT|nr:30S ribosome-binding factor RbfA [Thermodesulfatator atlanticus]
MKGHRDRRLADFIQEEVSQIIREELSDPALQRFITISQVEVSPDLKKANVYYQVHGDEEVEEAVARGFKRARSYIRHLLAQRLHTKFVPELEFLPDKREAEAERLEALFARIRHE